MWTRHEHRDTSSEISMSSHATTQPRRDNSPNVGHRRARSRTTKARHANNKTERTWRTALCTALSRKRGFAACGVSTTVWAASSQIESLLRPSLGPKLQTTKQDLSSAVWRFDDVMI